MEKCNSFKLFFLESLKLTPEVEKYLKQTDKDGFGRWLQKQLEDFFIKSFRVVFTGLMMSSKLFQITSE